MTMPLALTRPPRPGGAGRPPAAGGLFGRLPAGRAPGPFFPGGLS